MPTHHQTAGRVARAVIALITLTALGGCISISQRVWQNGEGMSESHAYGEVMNGSMSFRAHRELQSSMSPLRIGSPDEAYPLMPRFGTWW